MFKTTSAKVPGDLGFIFDIVIVHINLTNINVQEISKLKVDVKFIKNNIKITSSRINVTEFKSDRSLEFTERPSVLKEELFKHPLECQVYYDDQPVGVCTFLWPDSFINCIAGNSGRELTHCEEADIKKENQKVGRMEILVRLQIKCDEFDIKQIQQPKVNLCNQADNVIDPNDILFMVGEDKNGSIGCTDVDIIPASESGSSSANATCLDLSNFRQIHGKTVPNTDILDTMDLNCCKSKLSSNHCKQIIDDLMKKSKDSACCSKNKAKQELPCDQIHKPLECISDSRFASCSSSDTYNPCQCISDEYASESKSMICKTDGLREKPAKRYCPLCHENITWLPKFAKCPKCGYRPIPYNEEKPYDYKLTADQILQEFSNKKADDHAMDQPRDASLMDCQEKCRCTCKNGKICAHCRIKKLCEDIFKPPQNGEEDCGKCESKSSGLYNICKSSSRDCRPYLTKVFQELKDLYDKEPKKNNATTDESKLHFNKSQEANQIQKIEKASRIPQSNKQNFEAERKKFLVKNFHKHVSCKGKIFDYHSQRQYPGTKFGHKTCLNGFAGRKNVPRNMGWLWNAETKGLRNGWQPGAIRKPIKALMKHFLNEYDSQMCCDLQYNENCDKNKDEEEDYTKEPTLHICKRNGAYYITLRSLKGVEILNECTESFVNMKPIQFKITKNPLLKEIRKLKQYLKNIGFAKCICHKPISCCCCRSFLEKMKLEYQCCKECHKRQIPNCTDNLILSDTTDSETEFDFGVTPPAAAVQPDKYLKRRKTVSSATQYEENDWVIKEEYPKPLSKYFKLNNCAVGQRFGKAFGPYGSNGYSPGAVLIEGIYGPCGLMPEGMHGKGRAGRGVNIRGPGAFLGPDGKFSMALYLAAKASTKPSPEEIAEKKRQKLSLLKGVNPPLLCKVDRRGKPVDICPPCIPLSCSTACLRDNRIC